MSWASLFEQINRLSAGFSWQIEGVCLPEKCPSFAAPDCCTLHLKREKRFCVRRQHNEEKAVEMRGVSVLTRGETAPGWCSPIPAGWTRATHHGASPVTGRISSDALAAHADHIANTHARTAHTTHTQHTHTNTHTRTHTNAHTRHIQPCAQTFKARMSSRTCCT